MKKMPLSTLHSRVRIATVKSAKSWPYESPLRRNPSHVIGPYLKTSLPNWAAAALENREVSRESSVFVWKRRDTKATYVVHVLQCGSVQLRTMIPVACQGVRALLEHASERGQFSILFSIEDTNLVLELVTSLDQEAASVALTASQVAMSERVLDDEARLMLDMMQTDGIPTLIPEQQVQRVVVLFCGDEDRFQIDEETTDSFTRQPHGHPPH